ncbi:PREDICTED: diphosphomevalonate decarboxylase-like [Priapulus caudatus]|uniref:Diphosphomevalonate decarboxylase-like n=1 Tax=Priapulus caudatus TaxID=37621 RepID=A0ABM1EDU3_PRICU|nr:PREDICTED: diphosphomevalonate decarboxylase-like [Priapulus caudatus]
MKIVTCTAPINIAVVKYWGKRDSSLILPINDSVSATLSQDQLCAKTSAAASHQFSEDRIWLNGQEESIENVRLQKCLREIRRRCRKRKHSDTGGEDKHFSEYHVHICSENNFPTAAGLASSAAGYACLVYTLAQLFNVEGDISAIARQGSGSACRSVMGGFVRWLMGSNEDGSDSIAEQVVSETHWPELRVLVCVVCMMCMHVKVRPQKL